MNRIPNMAGRVLWAIAATPLLAPIATAQLAVELTGGHHVTAITVDGRRYPASELTPGLSSGPTFKPPGWDSPARAADNFDIGAYFARASSTDPVWRVDMRTWFNVNGPLADFFVFEVGGNDALRVRPRLTNGVVGDWVDLGNWQPTSFVASAGPNAGQRVHVIAFGFDDLRGPDGNPLPTRETIHGMEFSSTTVDGAGFLAVNPAPAVSGEDGDGFMDLYGRRVVWRPLELLMLGPWASELGVAPNPFLDYRMEVEFRGPSGQSYKVPGFFDANGRRSHEGRFWRARFSADEAGPWTAHVSFRSGTGIAVDLDPQAGDALAPYDGGVFSFDVDPPGPNSPGFLGRGRLSAGPRHYRVFPDGTPFLKGGTNSPENFFGYFGFDGVRDNGGMGRVHHFRPHRFDWRPGDPLFTSDVTGGDSRGIIGALNYLADQGVNSIYLLPMNLGGDCQDTAPFVGYENTPFNKRHYDVSRLRQWGQVLDHTQGLGISVQLVLAETEPSNESWLDGGALGTERKLYFRELIARFGHLLALKWNLSEENDYSVARLREFASYIRALDAYDHPISFHNHTDDFSDLNQVAGDSRFCATSIQYTETSASDQVEALRATSAAAGHPWVVEMDENTPWFIGLTDSNAESLRRRILYDVLFSGGGIEWYMGFHELPMGGDLTLEDFRTREPMWRWMRIGREFMETHLPFDQMEPDDELLTGESGFEGGGEVFALEGEVYAVYLPSASSTGTLDLSAATGAFRQRWFDPRAGVFAGAEIAVTGGGPVLLGPPPSEAGQDWVVLIERP